MRIGDDDVTFSDRSDAGRQLAAALARFKDARPVVLALPRGGVPVGFEIAAALEAPLDVVLVRKLGAPGFEELAIGAIAEGDPIETVIDRDAVAQLSVPKDYLNRAIERQTQEIQRRRAVYCGGRTRVDVHDRTAIVVDDGMATGATMRAALRAVRRQQPARLVMAVPVAPRDTIESLRHEADEIVVHSVPTYFEAISPFYAEFHQLRDEEVTDLLARAAARSSRTHGAPSRRAP
ncbi:MAG TPA: phosphoribosyltransferase [Stellaceae bacterium]|nr:phosphoribosyltransferase [Stellaceae bacterium]